jgi:hypothetical protein
MNQHLAKTLPLIVLLISSRVLQGDDTKADPKIEAQKKAAKENWALLEAGDPAHHETDHLLIFATRSQEPRLKEFGAMLEKYFTVAEKVLQLDPKKEMWPGKLTVYFFAERDEFTAFIRRVERRRLEGDETSTHTVEGDFPRVVTGPPRSKQLANLETYAAEELAAVLLQRKAGPKVILPDWLKYGFGRATTWRIAPREPATVSARKEAIELVFKKQRSVQQIWGGGLEPEEAAVLRPTLADLLAYGPGMSRFPAFVAGFRPTDGQDQRSAEAALQAAGIKVENLAKVWPDFVRNIR